MGKSELKPHQIHTLLSNVAARFDCTVGGVVLIDDDEVLVTINVPIRHKGRLVREDAIEIRATFARGAERSAPLVNLVGNTLAGIRHRSREAA